MKAGFLGRFQPFHEGHRKVIEKYRDDFDDFAVIVGSAGKERQQENPLSFEERKEVIRECFPDIEVLGLEDEGKTDEGNKRWAGKIESLGVEAVLSQNDLVQRIVREKTELDLVEQDLFDPEIYSGTEIRRRIRSGEEWRYLVPDCAKEKIEEFKDVIEDSGIDYEFKPGWKEENVNK